MAYFPLEIPVLPHMRDHAFDGRVMFSAAELLHLIAYTVTARLPSLSTGGQADALFPRFLLLPPEEVQVLPVQLELSTHPNGEVTARLRREFQSRSGAFSRLREHVRVRFLKEIPKACASPVFNRALERPGNDFEIPAERIYEELVPFGPAYRNIRGRLRLNAEGAVALLQTGGESFPGCYPGAPLITDAAFHAACVWGQRYAGRVVFPIGFSRRYCWKGVQAEVPYLCRVMPVGTERDVLIFDLWIHEQEGTLCEAILGLRMADVTAGRIKPPLWVKAAP